jgi:hypothetical membrane protein
MNPTRTLAFAGPLLFALVALAVQALHPSYDWVRAPLSFYLSGPHGPWLQGAYIALALAIAAQAFGSWRRASARGFESLALLLFCGGAVALIVTALMPGGTPVRTVSPLEHRIHGISALLAFGLTGLGMLVQGARDARRGDWRWLGLAVFAVAALLLHVFVRELPRGASQKAVIALYLLWLGLRPLIARSPESADVRASQGPDPVAGSAR